ncbi:MAG: RNA-guided endonuclease TnpB family protein [Acidothermaceae bacterium]
MTREVTFRFALDPTRAQAQMLSAHAGAARFAFNHHIARVKANLDQRAAMRTYGIDEADLTPWLSWSKFSFINEFNAWKNGAAADSPVGDDGARGLAWRGAVSADVFECASVDAAQACANFAAARSGDRAGKRVGFPRFKARHNTTPAFRLRNRARKGGAQQIRVAGPKALRLPTIGEIRVHGCTRKLRRMLAAGRCHLYAASLRFERGRWWVCLTGVAAIFHPARHSPKDRHSRPAGLDRGVKTLAVIADDHGAVLRVVEGVKALHQAQQVLRRANKALARTKPGSSGRRKAKIRLTRVHARIAHLRADTAHKLSHWAATRLTSVTIEDLNVAGMNQLRSLARAVADAGMGDLGRLLAYKTAWYGCGLHVADRWFPSSKTCSGCGQVKTDLTLSDRTYRCAYCGIVLDRDVNAAINLARWPGREQQIAPHTAAA